MKDFKDLLKAHSDRASLRVSIARWVKVIEKRTLAHATKLEEFENMPEIEEEPEAPEEMEVEEEPEKEEEENDSATEADAESAEVDPEEVQRKFAEKKEKQRLAAERKKLADEKKRAARVKLEAEKKERALKVKERNLVKASVDNLSAAVEKAKENLTADQEKLSQLEADFGEKLAFFQNDTDDADAQALFLEELKEGMIPIPEEEQEEVTEETETASGEATAEGDEENADETEKDAEPEEEGDTEMAEPTEPTREEVPELTKSDICHECGASGVAKKRFCGECGAKQIDPADANKVKEVPVWIVVMLKKPLEKFYVSDTNTTICKKELLEKSSMLIMEWNPKGDSEEQLKTLNTVLTGPWKTLIRKAELVLKGSSPYTLEKTVQYLVKKHKRQEVWDNTLEKCRLCANDVKRVVMERHLTKMCHMREEPCQYCEDVYVVSTMDEHYETCPRFPVKCPLRCGMNNLERCLVEEHKQTVCKNFEVSCEFKAMGCDMVLKRREVARHMRDLEIEHMKLVKNRMEIVSNYLIGKDSALETVFHPLPPAKEEEEPMEEEVGTETADQTSSKMEEE